MSSFRSGFSLNEAPSELLISIYGFVKSHHQLHILGTFLLPLSDTLLCRLQFFWRNSLYNGRGRGRVRTLHMPMWQIKYIKWLDHMWILS